MTSDINHSFPGPAYRLPGRCLRLDEDIFRTSGWRWGAGHVQQNLEVKDSRNLSHHPGQRYFLGHEVIFKYLVFVVVTSILLFWLQTSAMPNMHRFCKMFSRQPRKTLKQSTKKTKRRNRHLTLLWFKIFLVAFRKSRARACITYIIQSLL